MNFIIRGFIAGILLHLLEVIEIHLFVFNGLLIISNGLGCIQVILYPATNALFAIFKTKMIGRIVVGIEVGMRFSPVIDLLFQSLLQTFTLRLEGWELNVINLSRQSF